MHIIAIFPPYIRPSHFVLLYAILIYIYMVCCDTSYFYIPCLLLLIHILYSCHHNLNNVCASANANACVCVCVLVLVCLLEPAWGLKLGHRVAAIRSTGRYVQNNEQRRKVLDELGFLWRLRSRGSRGENTRMDDITLEQVIAALSTYRNEIQPEPGSLRIPSNFIVPNCDPWPENTRGLPLGSKIPVIRSKAYLKANPGATEMLRKIGFEFDGKVAANDERYNKVYNALVRYKEIHGYLMVPQPFVVPEQSDEWPEETWGLRLGARVNAI